MCCMCVAELIIKGRSYFLGDLSKTELMRLIRCFGTHIIRIHITATRGDDPSWGTYEEFIESLEKSFSPFDASGDALDAMKNLKMGDNVDEHISKFK